MIERSVSLQRALTREAIRYAGSQAFILFYKGSRPDDCNGVAQGERVARHYVTEELMRLLLWGDEPELPEGATYWRMYDGNGHCLMQGGA